jgi:hypothetical protein
MVEAFAFGFLLGSLLLSLYVFFLLLLSNTITAFLDLPVYFAEEVRRPFVIHASTIRQPRWPWAGQDLRHIAQKERRNSSFGTNKEFQYEFCPEQRDWTNKVADASILRLGQSR